MPLTAQDFAQFNKANNITTPTAGGSSFDVKPFNPSAPTNNQGNTTSPITKSNGFDVQPYQPPAPDNTYGLGPNGTGENTWEGFKASLPAQYVTNIVKNIYGNYQNAMSSENEAISEGKKTGGLAGMARAGLEGALVPGSDLVASLFSPLTELANTLAPASKEQQNNPLGSNPGEFAGNFIQAGEQGAIAGAPLAPVTAGMSIPLGTTVSVAMHGLQIMEQLISQHPKIKPILDANPDIMKDVNSAINLGLAGWGAKEGLNPTEAATGIPEPIKNIIGEPSGPDGTGGSGIIGATEGTIKNVGNTIKGAPELAGNVAKFGTSQATGLSPNTISDVINNPDNFSSSAMKDFTREGVAQKAIGDINARLSDLSDTGKIYGQIRSSDGTVKLDPNYFTNLIEDNTGTIIDKNGKIGSEASSTIRNPGDVAKLQTIYDRYQPLFQDGEMTNNEFLNLRQDLGQMAKYEGGIGSSKPLENLSDIMRGKLNSSYRNQIEGLTALDAKYGPEVEQLNQIKKDYFNSDGTLKDNAISKIANLTNKGRESVLGRLEQVSPGIGEKIATVKAVEDIANARGQKVGTYARAILGGTGLITGNIPEIVAAIISSPDIAVQVLRGFGKMLDVKDNIIENITKTYQSTKNAVSDYVKNPKMGGSIEDVSEKNIPQTFNKGDVVNINGSKLDYDVIKDPGTGLIRLIRTDGEGEIISAPRESIIKKK